MKRCFWHVVLVVSFLLLVPAGVQARQGELPPYLLEVTRPYVPSVEMPSIDAALERARVARSNELRFEIARVAERDIPIADSALWSEGPDDSLTWRMRLNAKGATDLNVGFSEFRLPAGARLWLISEDPVLTDYYQGPFTSADNASHGQFWSPLLPGSSVVVEVVVPADAVRDLELAIGAVGRGFQDVFGVREGEDDGGLQPCNVDVACSDADAYRDEVRSAVTYTFVEGTDQFSCSGTLVMDVPGSFKPFVLSAAHCGQIDPATVVTYFNYQSPSCGQLGGGSLNQSVSGATVRSQTSADTVDALLLELSAQPPAEFNVHYAGWDRSGTAPAGATVGIHHPGGLEKMISRNDDPLVSIPSCISSNTDITHWDLNWEKGITQVGSSGSALFDAQSKRVVGFLSGGSSSCTAQLESDCYGKFSVAWTGHPDNQNLALWLDPQNTGTMTVDGADPGSGGSGGGVPLTGASSGTYIVSGLSDQGFFLTVGANANGSRFLFFAWFTFDADGYPLWLVGVQNPLPANSNVAEVPVQSLSGPRFLDFSGQQATRVNFGNMRFEQRSCSEIQVDYDFGGNGTGSMTLNKLTGIDGLNCNG